MKKRQIVLPPQRPYKMIMTSTFGENVHAKNDIDVTTAPTIATLRQPNTLVNAPTIGPVKHDTL